MDCIAVRMKVALCQFVPKIGDAKANAALIADTMGSTNADVYVFPEMFITDYSFTDNASVMHEVMDAVMSVLDVTKKNGKCCIFGGPSFKDGSVFNTAYVLTDKVQMYNKINLAHFGPFDERDDFSEGSEPLMVDFDGFRFGIIICYDLFFPELSKMYAMNGADAVICISASPETSKTAFERVFPARAVEDTVYMIFVNNIGERGNMTFFGGSRCLSPTGDKIIECDDRESVSIVGLNHDTIEYARCQRPTLKDTHVWMMPRDDR
jgi:predicted amidohydrolase